MSKRRNHNGLVIASYKLKGASRDMERLRQIYLRVKKIEKLEATTETLKELDKLSAEIDTIRQRTGKV